MEERRKMRDRHRRKDKKFPTFHPLRKEMVVRTRRNKMVRNGDRVEDSSRSRRSGGILE